MTDRMTVRSQSTKQFYHCLYAYDTDKYFGGCQREGDVSSLI